MKFLLRWVGVFMSFGKVAIIMGSISDADKLKGAVDILKSLNIEYEVHVMSAHRTPSEACEFASHARENGFSVIMAAAGKAAHLAGVLAAHTILPVIGIPIKASTLDGLDALLSTVQMPKGVPVATVAIDGGDNAALLAAQIIAVADSELAARLEDMKQKMADDVREADKKAAEMF
jgi:5-(carboxyamino)imidazole ribonucleotide mutase